MTSLRDRLRIILIHGMAEKPPESRWLELWRSALVSNVRIEDRKIGDALSAEPEVMTSAYWADAIPYHVGLPAARVRAVARALEQVLILRRRWKSELHIPKTGWGDREVRRFGTMMVQALAESQRVEPEVRARTLAELRRVHNNPVIAERVHRPLEDRLREAWDDGCKVVIIAHSLGAGIAYDTLWRFSHRSEPELKRYRGHKVDLLVTTGSPLGDPVTGEIMLCGHWFEERFSPDPLMRRRAWPSNIMRWHNYTAMGDFVCRGLDMERQFYGPMRRDLKGYRTGDFRDYRCLFNPYREPGDVPNPHKSYGYLVQPKLAVWLCRLVRDLGG